jgi:molybdate transport repressor ModE-like protein
VNTIGGTGGQAGGGLSPFEGAERWNALELRHLLALRAIAEHGTFAAAAAQLGYTQSAISQQLAALERIVGQRLLERPPGRRPTGLTDAGQLLLRHAHEVLARVEAARADLATLAGDGGPPVRIGIYQSIGVNVLPAVLKRFRHEWPQVQSYLHEAVGDAELLAAVEAGELDLTFSMLPVGDGPFEAAELLRDRYVVAVPAGSALARRGRPPALHELAELPVMGFRTCRNEQRIEAYLRTRGIELNVVLRSDDNMTIQALVAAGEGVALLPRLSLLPPAEGVSLLELEAGFPERLIGVVWHRDRYRPPAASAFARISIEVCAELQNGALGLGR